MKPTIAILGASADRSKFGNKAVRAYLERGYDVFPIHPRESTVEGVTAYRSVRDLPVDRLDRVSVYLPPSVGMLVLEELTSLTIDEVHFNPGADAPEVLERAEALGLNVVVGCSILAIGVSPADLD
jgi:predicted CoA-binding protein